MKDVELLIIGGGPAGLSAALRAHEQGIKSVLLIERNERLGGILNQCIHNGFGLHIFKEELTGPEYAARLIDMLKNTETQFMTNTMVQSISQSNEKYSDKTKMATVISVNGVENIKARAVILAMGCRERPRGAINIPGDRCAGIFSAGTAQELVNMKGYTVGKRVVILGSGDIGLIMARRLTYEGAKVECIVELMPYSSGLKRNIVQCVEDYNIPLMYSSTITRIVGKDRVEGVYIANVDENRAPIKSTERFVHCDTILLSVGLIPENELSRGAKIDMSQITGGAIVDSNMETSAEGIFACGNALHVHDLVDNVTLEAFRAAECAALYLNKSMKSKSLIPIIASSGIRYAMPNYVDKNNIGDFIEIKFRSDNVYRNVIVDCLVDGKVVASRKRRIVTPGEMESVRISKGELAHGEVVTIEIKSDNVMAGGHIL